MIIEVHQRNPERATILEKCEGLFCVAAEKWLDGYDDAISVVSGLINEKSEVIGINPHDVAGKAIKRYLISRSSIDSHGFEINGIDVTFCIAEIQLKAASDISIGDTQVEDIAEVQPFLIDQAGGCVNARGEANPAQNSQLLNVLGRCIVANRLPDWVIALSAK